MYTSIRVHVYVCTIYICTYVLVNLCTYVGTYTCAPRLAVCCIEACRGLHLLGIILLFLRHNAFPHDLDPRSAVGHPTSRVGRGRSASEMPFGATWAAMLSLWSTRQTTDAMTSFSKSCPSRLARRRSRTSINARAFPNAHQSSTHGTGRRQSPCAQCRAPESTFLKRYPTFVSRMISCRVHDQAKANYARDKALFPMKLLAFLLSLTNGLWPPCPWAGVCLGAHNIREREREQYNEKDKFMYI